MTGHKNMIDMSESALMKKVREGHFGAIKFHLENNHRNYMSYKYRVRPIPDKNIEDSTNFLCDKTPRVLILDEEQSEDLRKMQSIEAWESMPERDKKYYIDLIERGDFREYMREKENQKEFEENEE